MTTRLAWVVTLAAAVLGAIPGTAATTAPSAQIDIAKVTCGDLKAASPLDRSAIVMFYWGYAAAKANATAFKTGLLKRATAALMSECGNNTGESIIDAMRRIDVKAF